MDSPARTGATTWPPMAHEEASHGAGHHHPHDGGTGSHATERHAPVEGPKTSAGAGQYEHDGVDPGEVRDLLVSLGYPNPTPDDVALTMYYVREERQGRQRLNTPSQQPGAQVPSQPPRSSEGRHSTGGGGEGEQYRRHGGAPHPSAVAVASVGTSSSSSSSTAGPTGPQQRQRKGPPHTRDPQPKRGVPSAMVRKATAEMTGSHGVPDHRGMARVSPSARSGVQAVAPPTRVDGGPHTGVLPTTRSAMGRSSSGAGRRTSATRPHYMHPTFASTAGRGDPPPPPPRAALGTPAAGAAAAVGDAGASLVDRTATPWQEDPYGPLAYHPASPTPLLYHSHYYAKGPQPHELLTTPHGVPQHTPAPAAVGAVADVEAPGSGDGGAYHVEEPQAAVAGPRSGERRPPRRPISAPAPTRRVAAAMPAPDHLHLARFKPYVLLEKYLRHQERSDGAAATAVADDADEVEEGAAPPPGRGGALDRRVANLIFDYTEDPRFLYRGSPRSAVRSSSRPTHDAPPHRYVDAVPSQRFAHPPSHSGLRRPIRSDPVRRGQQMRELWHHDPFLRQRQRDESFRAMKSNGVPSWR